MTDPSQSAEQQPSVVSDISLTYVAGINAPPYRELRFCRIALLTIAILNYIAGLGFLAWIATTVDLSRSGRSDEYFGLAIVGAVILGIGGIVHGFSAICNAMRDIARNSFRN